MTFIPLIDFFIDEHAYSLYSLLLKKDAFFIISDIKWSLASFYHFLERFSLFFSDQDL